jgi:hypothetical protein
MEDVIKSYTQPQQNFSVPEPAHHLLVREPDSWTGFNRANQTGTDSEFLLRSTLPYPMAGLFALVENHGNYPVSCQQLAEFLKAQIGHYPLEDLMRQVFSARFPRVWMERFMFILLEAQTSDWQTAAYVLQFRHLKRLLLRVERHKPLNPVETTLARDVIQALGLSRFTDLERFCQHATNTFKLMLSGRIPISGDLGLLINLIRSEAISMNERKNWLESDLGSGDPESVAKMTPLLKLLEERIEKAQEMANRLGSYGPVQAAPIALEEHMGTFFYAHFKEAIGRLPELAALKETLELQEFKRVPTQDLIALTSLCRWLVEARGLSLGPVEWIRMALEAYDRGHFRLDIVGAVHPGFPAMASADLTRAPTQTELLRICVASY